MEHTHTHRQTHTHRDRHTHTHTFSYIYIDYTKYNKIYFSIKSHWIIDTNLTKPLTQYFHGNIPLWFDYPNS